MLRILIFEGEGMFTISLFRHVLLSACFCLAVIFFPSTAHAYLDPGTGSMLVSAMVGIVAALFFSIKGIYYRGLGFYYGLRGKKLKQKTESIVFYSEGSQYWNVFRPIIDALEEKGEKYTYLTSDENDPALSYLANGMTVRFIGVGNRAYSILNMLETDLCVMTTPGLDVLQIRRSPGVKHYAHIVHMPGEVTQYRRYALDYYDSLFTSGFHQENSTRILENKRGITPKQILQSGCSYYDVLMSRKKNLINTRNNENIQILVAPTWGTNSLLTLYGLDLLKALVATGYDIVVRPHPQSRLVQQDLLAYLQKETAAISTLSWDNSPDNFEALSKADILLSDYSGITFDFAFVMERPVLTMDFTPNFDPFEAHDLLPDLPWNYTSQNKIGRKITLNDIPKLPTIIKEIVNNKEMTDKIRSFRDESVYNFGCAGPVIAAQLIEIRNSLYESTSSPMK